TLIAVVEIRIELGDETVAALRENGLVQRTDHPHQRRLEDVRRIAEGVRYFLAPRRHAVKRAMRLDMIQLHALGLEEALERADLIDEAVGELLAGDFHLAAAEALEIRQGRMGSDLDAVLASEPNGSAHVVEIRGVKAAGDVGRG